MGLYSIKVLPILLAESKFLAWRKEIIQNGGGVMPNFDTIGKKDPPLRTCLSCWSMAYGSEVLY